MGKFKDKECKTLFGKILQHILFHHYTQLGIVIFFLLLSGTLVGSLSETSTLFDISYLIFNICSVLLGLFVVFTLIFVWIINPIKNKKDKI